MDEIDKTYPPDPDLEIGHFAGFLPDDTAAQLFYGTYGPYPPSRDAADVEAAGQYLITRVMADTLYGSAIPTNSVHSFNGVTNSDINFSVRNMQLPPPAADEELVNATPPKHTYTEGYQVPIVSDDGSVGRGPLFQARLRNLQVGKGIVMASNNLGDSDDVFLEIAVANPITAQEAIPDVPLDQPLDVSCFNNLLATLRKAGIIKE